MRIIEFRGKSNNGEWITGSLRIDPEKTRAFIGGFKYYTGWVMVQRDYFEAAVKADTVGQYTGIDDMNKNRIFEGDIVRAFIPKNEFGNEYTLAKGYVFFGEGSFCIYGEIISPPLIDFASRLRRDIKIEIIGNVYDGVKNDETKEN